MVHIFSVLAPFVKKIVNKKSEMEITQKFCQMIVIFGFNTLNLVLIDKLKGS
jgi:hypothetical protein